MDWGATIKEQEASGIGVREFCEQRGIKENRFYLQGMRQRKQGLGSGKFARVETTKRISLELECGTIIRVEVSDLKAVLLALQ